MANDTAEPAPSPYATLGARLREAREVTGLLVGQVAHRFGVPTFTVLEHEADRTAPNDIELARYAKLYDVAVAALRDGVTPATADDLGFPPGERAKFDRLPEGDRNEILRVATWLRAGRAPR
jgi:DNA-binding transcriptional regulator YiaG